MKKVKSVVTKCHECGSTSNETILEFIKSEGYYLCEYCLEDSSFEPAKDTHAKDDEDADQDEEEVDDDDNTPTRTYSRGGRRSGGFSEEGGYEEDY